MRLKIILLLFISVGCLAEKRNEFEIMLKGIETCNLKNMVGHYTADENRHPYFTNKNLQPHKVDSGLLFYRVSEKFIGLHVNEIVIPTETYFYVFAVFVDEPIEVVSKYWKKNYLQGYYTSEEWEKEKDNPSESKPVIQTSPDGKRTAISCK